MTKDFFRNYELNEDVIHETKRLKSDNLCRDKKNHLKNSWGWRRNLL